MIGVPRSPAQVCNTRSGRCRATGSPGCVYHGTGNGTGDRDGLDSAAVCWEKQDRLPENPGLRFIVYLVSALSQPPGFSDPRPRPMDPEKASAPRFFMAHSAHLGGGEGEQEGAVHQVGISRRIAHRSGNSGYSTRFQESRHPPSSVPVGNLRFHTCSLSSKRANPKPNGGTAGANCPPPGSAAGAESHPVGVYRLGVCGWIARSIGVGVGPKSTMTWRWNTILASISHHLSLLTCQRVRQAWTVCSARQGHLLIGQHFSRESGPITTGMAVSRWAGVPEHRLPRVVRAGHGCESSKAGRTGASCLGGGLDKSGGLDTRLRTHPAANKGDPCPPNLVHRRRQDRSRCAARGSHSLPHPVAEGQACWSLSLDLRPGGEGWFVAGEMGSGFEFHAMLPRDIRLVSRHHAPTIAANGGSQHPPRRWLITPGDTMWAVPAWLRDTSHRRCF